MPFSYEQLRLGAHPFSLKREERKKRKQSLEEQLALVNAAPCNPTTASPAIAAAIPGANVNAMPPVATATTAVALAPIILFFVLPLTYPSYLE